MHNLKLWVLAGLLTSPAFAQKAWFTLVNDSGYTIDYMYVRPAGDPDWSEDVLGQDNLPPDQLVDIQWTGKKVPKIFDVHLRYDDGEETTIPGLSPPSKYTKLHIYYDDKGTLPRWE